MMEGSGHSDEDDIIIVGGGITGLSAAYYAARAGKRVTVIEAGKYFGGLMNTFELGGTQLECYYHHFFTHDAEINHLIRELGIQDDLVFRKTSMGIFRNGRIYPFNNSIDLLKFSPVSLLDRLRFGITGLYLGRFADWKKFENVSAMSWLTRWAGKTSSASIWKPLLKIKFGPYAKVVPLSWMIGRLKQRFNSRKNGDELLGYLNGSLNTLLQSLLKKLRELNVNLVNECPINNVHLENNKVKWIESKEGVRYSGKQYLFTIPGFVLSAVLDKNAPVDLVNQLRSVKYFGAVCVILEMKKKLSDIYWLNIADSGFPFGGIIEHTNFINADKYNGNHIAYLSRYFSEDEEISGMSNDQIKTMMLGYLDKIYPDFKAEQIKDVHVFRTNTAATVCDFNFSAKVPRCDATIENMFIANMSHVYPDERSVNNSIRVSLEALKVMNVDHRVNLNSNSLSAQIGF